MFPLDSIGLNGTITADTALVSGSINSHFTILGAYMMFDSTTTTASAELQCGSKEILKVTNRMGTNLPAIRFVNWLGVQGCNAADINIDVTNLGTGSVTYQVTYIDEIYANSMTTCGTSTSSPCYTNTYNAFIDSAAGIALWILVVAAVIWLVLKFK